MSPDLHLKFVWVYLGGTCVSGTPGGVIDRYCGEILACSADVNNAGSQLSVTSSVCSKF